MQFDEDSFDVVALGHCQSSLRTIIRRFRRCRSA